MQKELKHPIAFEIICAIIFIMTEFLGSRYLGPLSLRNYAILFCVVLPMIIGRTPEKSMFKSYRFLIFYYVFVMILGAFNDLYLEGIGRELVLARFVPMIVIFVFLTASLKNHNAKVLFVYFLLFITAIDAIATILQGIGNSIGWVIKSFFSITSYTEIAVEEESSVGYSFASGISGTVVANGFLLASLGLLYWVPYKENKTIISFLVSFFLWLLFLGALFFNQQRMAFYVFLLFSAMILLLLSRSKIKLFFIVISLVLVSAIHFEKIASSLNDVGRLSNVTMEDVSERHIKQDAYYKNFFPDHFLTGDRYQYVVVNGYTPHNMIIETLLLGGIIGLFIYLFFIISFTRRLTELIKHNNISNLLYSLPVIAILLISLEHSSGFHTGMTLGAYCMAVFELSYMEV